MREQETPSPEEIAALTLFAGLSAEEHAKLSAIARVVRLTEGATLFTEGDAAGPLYVVREGRVTLSLRVPGRDEASILSLRAGELLGWSALLARPRVATARVVSACRLLELPASALLELAEADHHVGYVIMRAAFEELGDRLQATRLQLLDVYGKR